MEEIVVHLKQGGAPGEKNTVGTVAMLFENVYCSMLLFLNLFLKRKLQLNLKRII